MVLHEEERDLRGLQSGKRCDLFILLEFLFLSLSSSPPTECWPHMNHSPPSLSTFLMHCSAFRSVHVVTLSSRDNPRSSFSSASWPYPLYDIFFSKQLPAFYVQSIAIFFLFRLDALAKALSVIATATWLGGWLAGWVAGWLGVCHTPVLYQNG